MIGQLRRNKINDYISDIDTSFSDNIITGNFIAAKHYYISIDINTTTQQEQNISIVLKNSENGQEQTIKRMKIMNGDNESIETVFVPNAAYDQIIIKDCTNYTVALNQAAEINNVLTKLGINKLTKIGVQGPSGLVMDINGEEIRIGRFGIYELIRRIDINFISFIVNNDDDRFFILDYQY